MHNGIILYLMGPSGAGKDSLLRHALLHIPPDVPGLRPLRVMRRYVTRPGNRGCAVHSYLQPQEFLRLRAENHFTMHWERHDILYGIGPELDENLALGALTLINGSRSYLPEAMRRYPDTRALLITAKPEVLLQRLAQRGRENAEEIQARMNANAEVNLPPGSHILENSGEFAESATLFSSIIDGLRR